MRHSIKAYVYEFAEGWCLSKAKLNDCSVQPKKVKITFLPDTPHETKEQLRRSLRFGLVVQALNVMDIQQGDKINTNF